MSLIGVLLVIGIPLLEIYLLVKVGQQIGILLTLLLLISMMGLGLVLVKELGLRTLFMLADRLQKGDLPSSSLLEGGLLLVSGLLFILPGLATDVVALLLLLPWVRRMLVYWWIGRMFNQESASVPPRHPSSNQQTTVIVEGEYQKNPQEADQAKPPANFLE